MKNQNGQGLLTRHNYLGRKTKSIITTLLITVSISILGFFLFVYPALKKTYRDITLTFAIADGFADNSRAVNVTSLYRALKQARVTVEQYFPDGEFGYVDLLALAYVESCYYPLAVGTQGEVGTYQIYKVQSIVDSSPAWFKKRLKGNDYFDLHNNTHLGCYILSQKYKETKDYKKAIINYNGAVVYWNKFIDARRIIDRAVVRLDYGTLKF